MKRFALSVPADVQLPTAAGSLLAISPASGRQVWYPSVVPGNRAVVFTHSENHPDGGTLELLVLGTGERRTLLEGAAGRVLTSGHLAFVRGGTLWAATFDLDSLAVLSGGSAARNPPYLHSTSGPAGPGPPEGGTTYRS